MRVTLDIDNKKPKIIEAKAKLLKIAYPEAKVQWRISSSGKGGHILMYERKGIIDEDMMYNIRYLLGDHDKRILIDWGRGKNGNADLPQQVLFEYKLKRCELWDKCSKFNDKCRLRYFAGKWNAV